MIFPALITVLIATIFFGYFTLTNEEYKLLGRHVKASATFLSNFYYWREAGYKDICQLIDINGELLYKDYDHLSIYANIRYEKYLKVIFNKINPHLFKKNL
jgi:hypothetical protein